jgi:hypothetical protein
LSCPALTHRCYACKLIGHHANSASCAVSNNNM